MVDYKRIIKAAVTAATVGILTLYSPPALGQETQDQVKKKEDIVQIDYTLEKRVNNSIYMSTHDMYSEVYNNLKIFPIMAIYLTLDNEKKNLDDKQFKEVKGFVDKRIKTMDAYPEFIKETALEYKNTMEPLLKELKEAQDKYEDTDSIGDWEAYDTLRDDIEERLELFTQKWNGIPKKISGSLNDLIETLNDRLEKIKKKIAITFYTSTSKIKLS